MQIFTMAGKQVFTRRENHGTTYMYTIHHSTYTFPLLPYVTNCLQNLINDLTGGRMTACRHHATVVEGKDE